MKFYFPRPPFGHPEWLPANYYQEQAAGLLSITPLYLIGLLTPLFLALKKRWENPALPTMLMALYASSVALLVCVSLTGWVAVRYSVDFAPALLVLSLFFALLLIYRANTAVMRSAAVAVLVGGCIWGAATNTALSINGYDNSLAEQNPRAFSLLASLFGQKPQSQQLRINGLSIEAKIIFARWRGNSDEVFLTSGHADFQNTLYLDMLDRGRISFRYDRFGEGGPSTRWVRIVPGREYSLEITYTDVERRLRIRLNGETLLDHPTVFYPTARQEVTIGSDGFGGLFGNRRLSAGLKIQRFDLTFLPRRIVPADVTSGSWTHGIRTGAGGPGFLFSGPEYGNTRVDSGDTLVFAGSGKRKVVSVKQGASGFEVRVDGPLDATGDGYPNEIVILD